jgi:hypothetical protein
MAPQKKPDLSVFGWRDKFEQKRALNILIGCAVGTIP